VSVHRPGATSPFGRRPGQHQQANVLGKATLVVSLPLTRSTELQVDENWKLEKNSSWNLPRENEHGSLTRSFSEMFLIPPAASQLLLEEKLYIW